VTGGQRRQVLLPRAAGGRQTPRTSQVNVGQQEPDELRVGGRRGVFLRTRQSEGDRRVIFLRQLCAVSVSP
jgi:hypothetical protein